MLFGDHVRTHTSPTHTSLEAADGNMLCDLTVINWLITVSPTEQVVQQRGILRAFLLQTAAAVYEPLIHSSAAL